MPGLIIGLLILWAIVAIIGFAIKALLWLAIVGLVFFAVTMIAGLIAHARKR
jgi:hypothetical protein